MTDTVETVRNPIAAPGLRTAVDAVSAELVARLVRGITAGPEAETIAVRSPLTGEVHAELPRSGAEDVATAFDRAREAQRDWAARPVSARSAVLLRFHDLLFAQKDDLLDLVQAETGKARSHAFEELGAVAVAARHYGRAAGRYLRTRRRTGVFPVLTHVREIRHPKGVVGQISPWNYPLELSIGDVLPAFAAGNGVVTKPDTQTALTCLRAREILVEAGLPADLWQIVIGDGPVVGPEVVDRGDFVSFTGSTRTGKEVAQRAAGRLVGSSLELGGKNAMLVLRDADLDRAAEGAVRACFSSAGQLCISIERLFVAREIADAFLERFAERVRGMKLGNTLSYGADMGSLVSERQLHTVLRHVDEAVKNGATVLAGGKPRPDLGPFFYEPTVLDGVDEQSAVCAEETFGPVVSVYRFDSEDEAIARANATRYGLNSSVWTKDGSRGRAVAARLQTGTVNVNEGYAPAYASAAAPMGGMKESGVGRRHGSDGILKYTEVQTVATQRVVGFGPAFGMSDEQYAAFLGTSLRVLKALRLK